MTPVGGIFFFQLWVTGMATDLVIWDSHPLALGATPLQVYIDGIPQIAKPFAHEKPLSFQEEPKVPSWDNEREEAVAYEGLPPLLPSRTLGNVVFEHVASVWLTRRDDGLAGEQILGEHGVVVVSNGQIVCTGTHVSCSTSSLVYTLVDLANGSLVPGFTSFGSPLGLVEIIQEASTQDGAIFDPLQGESKAIAGGDAAVVRAVDGLQFATRDAL